MIGTALQAIAYLGKFASDNTKQFEVSERKETITDKQRRYFHRLVGLLAKGERVPFARKKNELIRSYGNQKFLYENGEVKYQIIPETNKSWQDDPVYHYVPTDMGGEFRGKPARLYLCLEGTSRHTREEMVHLIDCTRDECLGCDIPLELVETFEEKQMMEQLRRSIEKRSGKKQHHFSRG